MAKNVFLSTFLSPIKARLLYAKKLAAWRKKNTHNATTVNEYCPIDVVTVGRETYGKINAHWYGKPEEALHIGNFCSIADEVHFILGGNHDYERLTSFPFPERIYHEEYDGVCRGPIVVEDDVWIGYGAVILSGVTIGKGSVIAARSVVTKNVEPYTIWIGNKPAKKRFSEEIINKLSDFDLNSLSYDEYKKYSKIHITEENVDEVLSGLKKEKL